MSRLIESLLLHYDVPDRKHACKNVDACAIYACAVVLRKTYKDVEKWFCKKNAKCKTTGYYKEDILQCLRAFGLDAVEVTLNADFNANNLAESSQVSRDVMYILVYKDHVVAYHNGLVNERCKGGWMSALSGKRRLIYSIIDCGPSIF